MPAQRKIKLAILDMYEGAPNEGMRCIKAIVDQYGPDVDWEVFDVRHKGEVPGKQFDVFISSGGPGSPFDGEGKSWEPKFFKLMDDLWAHNANGHQRKKYMFAICHSFQLLSRHFQLGEVCKRKSTAFGVFPIHKTESGKRDRMFRNLPDPYYVVDSRDWQLIEPNLDKMTALGANILAMEKKREHVPLPRAVMAVGLGDYIYMTQFHPETDAKDILRLFAKPERRETIRANHGDWKIEEMIRNLTDSDKLPLTHNEVLPYFMRSTLQALRTQDV